MPIDFGDALDAQGKIIREDKGEIDFGDPIKQSGQVNPIDINYEGQIKGLDIDDYSKYIKGGIYSTTGLDKTRAINQSTGEQAIRAIGTGVAGGGLMFLENVGYIADVADWGTASDDMDNWLSEYVRELKTDLNTEFPIYKENPNEVFDFSDPASYFEALKSTVESVVGFGLTGAAVGGLIGKGAFALFKIIKGTAKGAEMIAKLGTTIVMNYAESSMMVIELRENIIKEATENGISYDKALAKANEKAKEFLWANKVTAVTDYITLGSIFKSNYYTRGLEKEFKNFKLKDTFQYGLKESVGEYGEEVSAGTIQREKEFQASKELGLKPFDESTMAGRAFDYITSPEGILEGVMGFVGGPAQAGALKGTNKLKEVITKSKTSPSENLEDYYIENTRKEFEETVKNDAVNLEKKIKAYREGDTKTVDDISRQEFDELALKHFKKKTTGNLEKAIQEVIQKTENPVDKKRAEEYLALLPEMEKRYNAISQKHSLQKPYIIEDIWKLDSRKNFVQKVIIDLNNDITSKQGQLDLKIANLGLNANSINYVKLEELKTQKEALTKAAEAIGENDYINKSIINFQLSQVTDNYEALNQTLQETQQDTEISEGIKNLSEFEELASLVKQKADAFVALKTYDGLYDFYNNPKHIERQEKDIVDYQLNEINSITDIDDIYTILDNVDKYNEVLSPENYKKIVKAARLKKDKLVDEKADRELRKKLTDDRELELQKQKDEIASNKTLEQIETDPEKKEIKATQQPPLKEGGVQKKTESSTRNTSRFGQGRITPMLEKDLSGINETIAEVFAAKAELTEQNKELENTLDNLNSILEDTVDLSQDKINSIIQAIENLNSLLTSNSKKKSKYGQEVQQRLDTLRNGLKSEFMPMQDLKNKINEFKETINQNNQVIKDLQAQIDYYKNLINDPTFKDFSKEELDKKIKQLQKKKSILQNLISKFKKILTKTLEYLKEFVKASNKAIKELDALIVTNDFKLLNTEELKEKIKLNQADNYAKLKKEYEKLEKTINSTLDGVEVLETNIPYEQKRINKLENEVTIIDDQIRYIEYLLANNIQELKEKQKENKPEKKSNPVNAKKAKTKVVKNTTINNKKTEIDTENISKKKAKNFIKNAVSSDKLENETKSTEPLAAEQSLNTSKKSPEEKKPISKAGKFKAGIVSSDKIVDTEFELSEQEVEGEEDTVNTILNTSDNIDDLKVNDYEEKVKSDLNVIRYRDTTLTEEAATTEKNRISNKLNKGLTDWLNDPSSKIGTSIKASVDLTDAQFGGKVGKAAIDKFKSKVPIEQWSKEEIANLPIRLNVLNTDDSPKSINNNKVQGWLGTVDEDNKSDYDKRYKIVKALLNGGDVTSTINEITQGKFERRTDEENKDFLEGGKEFQNIYDILTANDNKPKLLIANIEGELTDASRKPDTSFTGFYTPGYAFLSLPVQREIGKKKMKFPLRLNTRRVSQEEAELLLSLVKDILIDGKKFKSELNHKNAKGLTRFQAIKFLGFQGLKAMEASEHGFYIKVPGDKIAKDVKIGLNLKQDGTTKNYSIAELKKGTFDAEILEIFKTIPSPVERSHINKSFDAVGFTKDFEWFGNKISRLSGYNEFIFSTKKVYSNLKMYSQGQMFLNPQVRINEFTIKDKTANTANAESNSGTKIEQVIKDKAVKSKASLFISKAKSADKVDEISSLQKEEVDTDIELGIFGNSEGTLWSEYNGTEKDKINIENTLSFLEKNLPYVKAKVINSLLQMPNGGIAQGSYYNKLITLSRRGAKGTEYHEAFHAVLDLYLDENERQTLFEEYRKKNNSKLIDSKINEKLADEFKDYMLSKGELNIPSWVKPLYNALLDLINYFRSDRHKIFANIRAGRFNYAPINKADADKFYSTTLNPKDTKDVVDYISYLVVNNLGILKTDFKRESLQNSNVENIYENLRKAINNKKIDLQTKFDESNPTVQLFKNILDNWNDYVVPMSRYKLASLGLVEKENTKKDSYELRPESEGEDIEGNDLYGVTRFELDVKDNAAGNIKVMLSFLPNQNDISVLGTPRFHSLDETFKYFASNLSGIVAGPGENLYELFREKLSELSLEKDFVKTVISKLEGKTKDGKELTQLKTQFCAAFSNESIIYYTVQGNKENKEFNWRIFNSSASGGANRFINKWKDAFYVKFINEDGTIANKEVIEKAINDFSNLLNSYKTETSKDQVIEALIPIFNSLGFNLTKEGINDYIKSSKSAQKALIKLSYFFKFKPKKYADINLADLIKEDYIWNESNNPFTTKDITVKAIRELAKGESNQSKVRGDGKILGAEGNMYYDLSLYSYMSKQIALWKRDDSYLNKLYEDSYHKHSLFLRWMLTDDNIQNFNIGAHISNKVIDKNEALDTGTKNVNLTAIDELVERINTTLNGYYSPLTFADKPTKYFFTGPGYEEMKSGIKYNAETNRYSLSPRVLETFINYFNSEANRTVDRLNLKLISETNGLNYKPLAKNELKNSIFPSLSYGTETANKFNLYFLTEGESEQRYVLRKNLIEDPEFVKYIAQIIVNNINSRVKSIEKLGIVKGGKILGVDKELSNYSRTDSRYDNLNELIADYWYMSFVGNIETMFLFGGDPTWYSDISKRIPEIISSGLMLQEGVIRKEFKVSVARDIETNTPDFYENNLQKLIELNTPKLGKSKAKEYAEALMNPYKKVNQADAQAYITIDRFREILIGLGRWDYDKHEKAYNKLLNGEEVDIKELPSLQALKGTHYELRHEKDTLIPTFMKYSQAVLFPQLVKGTYLEIIYNHMKANDVDELVMESGFKVGAIEHEINDISDLSEESFKGSLNTITLQNAYWKLQVDNPTKYSKKGEALAGSQAEKNILVNINMESNYGEQTGAEVITDFVNTIGALSAIGKDKLLKKLGLDTDKDGNILGNINLDKIYEDLLEKAYTDEYPSNVIQAIEDRVPLDAIFQMNEKIQSELLSTINKATVKLKMPGAAFIQMSNFGMRSLKVISPENILFDNFIAEGLVKFEDENGNPC